MLENVYLEYIEEIGMSQSSKNSIFTILSPKILAVPPNNYIAKNTKKCKIDSFFISEDHPTKLDNFHKLFSKYITTKSIFSHPNIEYLSSHLCLRKF